jgi:hypothetical protein
MSDHIPGFTGFAIVNAMALLQVARVQGSGFRKEAAAGA